MSSEVRYFLACALFSVPPKNLIKSWMVDCWHYSRQRTQEEDFNYNSMYHPEWFAGSTSNPCDPILSCMKVRSPSTVFTIIYSRCQWQHSKLSLCLTKITTFDKRKSRRIIKIFQSQWKNRGITFSSQLPAAFQRGQYANFNLSTHLWVVRGTQSHTVEVDFYVFRKT